MEDRGIEANAQLLQPVTAIDVFVRLCLNLLNLYRSSVSHPHCLHTLEPVTAIYYIGPAIAWEVTSEAILSPRCTS